MSREYALNQRVVFDLFDRDSGSYTSAYGPSDTEQNRQLEAEETAAQDDRAKKVKPQFNEDLWEDVLKRHCDARQNLRSLLDRYIKPHH